MDFLIQRVFNKAKKFDFIKLNSNYNIIEN